MRIRQTIHIHSIKTEYHIRQSHHDGQCGQHLHHDVQVVGDHAGEGIHGAREDVPVDVAHLNGLLVLDDHVLQQVRVLGVIPHKVHAQQLLQHDLVALQAGGEVHQALFQPQHLNQLFVLHGFVQLVLHLVGGLVDLAQQRQKQGGVPVQERAWKSALEQSGVYDAASQERIMQSFTELDGAYFASEEDRNLNRKVGQMIQQAMQMDKNEIQEACAREAAQAAKAYEVMVKE